MTVSLNTSSSPTLHDPDSLLDYFTELADPRREQGRIHRLDEIIFLSICAVTCGADSWEGERNGDAAGELSRCSWHGEEDTKSNSRRWVTRRRSWPRRLPRVIMTLGFTISRKSGPASPEIRSTGSCTACGVGSQSILQTDICTVERW